MSGLRAYVEGMGVLGPGINDWPEGRAILRGEGAYIPQKTVYPPAAFLPANERRRCSAVVRLALSIGFEAIAQAGLPAKAKGLPAVFASSSGDNSNCHVLCEQLATDDRDISPTRFHNSVTNAPAGYWSIATKSMESTTMVCAFHATFGAGLLESLVQVAANGDRCILIAYDIDFPEPLRSVCPIPDGFGVGMVLAANRTQHSLAALQVALAEEPADRMVEDPLEELRRSIPAARSLPMLRALANAKGARVVLDYLDTARLAVTVTPCA